MRRILLTVLILVFLMPGCGNSNSGQEELIVFHAGSLSVPFRNAAEQFRQKHPGLKILLEPAGSLVCARKITELKRPCDMIASADHQVIDRLLIPEYTSWNIRFAANEMVIVSHEASRYLHELDSLNWFDILMREDVTYGRSDPDSDPCGYRAVLTMKLAEMYYSRPGIADMLLNKNRSFIRPKEVDLVALVESNAVDYIFIYKSVAVQHKLNYLTLPGRINLGDPQLNGVYNKVSVDVAGSKPGSRMTINGEFINYSLSVLSDAPNRETAIDFAEFLLGPEGQAIMRSNGQEPVIPCLTAQPEMIPLRLRKFVNI